MSPNKDDATHFHEASVHSSSSAYVRTKNSSHVSKRFRPFARLVTLGLAGLMVVSGGTAAFAEGGGGGVPGSGTGSSGAFHLYNMQYDEFNQSVPLQGYMDSSTEWFINNYGGPGATDTSMGTGAQDQIRAACSIALANAEARGGGQGMSRVVGIVWAGSSTSPWASSSSASASLFQEVWDNVAASGFPGVYTEAAPFMQQYWPEGIAAGGATPSAVCVALNQNEPPTAVPEPDKGWVLDENGALVTADPEWSNTVGADGQIFLPGEDVGAVVNGRVPAGQPHALTKYQIVDDWTKAGQYVDFSDASRAKVFYETAPGSDTYVNVTDQFTISVEGTVTTATAGAEFLAATANQPGDRKVKLSVMGNFRTDYVTEGETVTLWNNGFEVWNDEKVDTNEPPVYTWTPEPNKQVLGSNVENGDNAGANINGMSVFPGQWLEYSIGVDLNIPGGLAHGVKSLAVEDAYDANFLPVKSSVQFWDGRDAQNPKVVPRSAYSIAWDDENHTWTATFTDAWLKENLDEGSQWLKKGWLTARFHGVVSKNAAPGSEVKNQAFEILNGSRTATEIPTVKIPNVEPDKEDLNTDLIDIDGKGVVVGDTILYRLTLDASVTQEELAYKVHKLGMTDDYDEQYLKLNMDAVRITGLTSGEDVTGKFNMQDRDGVFYAFAKQVDSEGPAGDIIKGDPQPADLAAYAKATIDPAKTPVIDQALMGQKYSIMLPMTVIKSKDGYVIENQAVQNLENVSKSTRVVSNPLKEIQPDKDVVVESGDGDSINGTEIPLNDSFNYRLNTSQVPGDMAYKTSQWSIADSFDRTHDQYTGQWAVYANADVFDGETLVAKKGELLQDSSGNGVSKDFFTAVFDEATYTLTVNAEQAFFDLVSSRPELPRAWSLYAQMVRIHSGEKIVNTHTETYNNVARKSNEVWTSTPEPVAPVKPVEPASPLAVTGGTSMGLIALGGGVLLATGAAGMVYTSRKRRAIAAISSELTH